jgi:AraC-like DNA-binding protein
MSVVKKGKLTRDKPLIVEKVIELNAQGLTNAQISELVGRVPRQVKEYLDQLNIPSHGRPGRNKQTRINEIGPDVIRLRELGWSYRRIEKELKSSKRTVARIYQDYANWKSEGRRELPWDVRKYGAKIVNLKGKGLTWKQVCEEIGCKECTAVKIFNQMTGRVPRTQEEISKESERKGIIAKWLKAEDFCDEDIAAIIGASPRSIRRYLK